jgi:tyrosyl-tRNA synthetase
VGLVDVLVAAGLFASRGEARRLIRNGGLTVNDDRVSDAEARLPTLLAGEWLVVRVGKRKLHVGRRADG